MTALVDVNGHALETGCYVEGHRGWHGHAHMISVATDLGYPITDEDAAVVQRYDAGGDDAEDAESWLNDNDAVVWIMDDAESWLNDHTARGYVWHWRDGEFFLSPLCDDEDTCTDETCAHWD